MLPAAEADLDEAFSHYIGEGSVAAASALHREVRRAAGLLPAWPRLGRLAVGQARVLGLRRFPYNLVYRLDGGEILIVAVAHHSRLPRYWRGRS